ncbi:MAG: glycosyltransferase family 2 protein [Oligoflexia bacterium]|nr:glycosyltransferase family 2 protein [Oligoflexia bacterium]
MYNPKLIPSVSVIIPALNEEKNIREAIESVLRSFEKLNIDGEVIAVDDGSSDNTGKIMNEMVAIYANVKKIAHRTPHGIGGAFWSGVTLASKEIVTVSPGDNENDPEQILSYLGLTSEVDIIVPFVYNVDIRAKGRRLISSLYRLIINMSFGTNLNYTNGTVLYRRAILKDVALRSRGFFYQAELLIKLIRLGYLFAEVPCFLSKRTSGKSKATTIRSFIRIIQSYCKLVLEIHVLRMSAGTQAILNTGTQTHKKMMIQKELVVQ